MKIRKVLAPGAWKYAPPTAKSVKPSPFKSPTFAREFPTKAQPRNEFIKIYMVILLYVMGSYGKVCYEKENKEGKGRSNVFFMGALSLPNLSLS